MLRQLKAVCRQSLDAVSWCVWDYGNARERIRTKRLMMKSLAELVKKLRNRPV